MLVLVLLPPLWLSSAKASWSIAAALEKAAAGTFSSQVTATALTACSACQGVSAITATPAVPPWWPSTASTCFTPGSASAAAPSKACTLPPSVGHMATVA